MAPLFIPAMVLTVISYEHPSCPNSSHTGIKFSTIPNALDDVLSTCDNISRPDVTHIEVIWRFPAHKSGMNSFRVVLSGSQDCSDENTVWFVSIDMAGILTECRVSQNTNGELKECLITCECPCAKCGYLHFRVQIPGWMRRTLAICHFELLNEYDTVELPYVIVWISKINAQEQINYRLSCRGTGRVNTTDVIMNIKTLIDKKIHYHT